MFIYIHVYKYIYIYTFSATNSTNATNSKIIVETYTQVITSYFITLFFGLLIKSCSLLLNVILRSQFMRPLAQSSGYCYIVFQA